jgi:isomaltose glucohydrolase
MSRWGEVESAEAFFGWCARTVERHAGDGLLRARYTLDGDVDPDPTWAVNQIDGFGTWVWALAEHARRHGRDLAPFRHGAELSLDYVAARWRHPCHDWWEEREGVHAATLACIAAGLGDALDRSLADERLDASLLVLPFLGFEAVDVSPLVSPGGGVHRHPDDVYYGGGEWLLLTALLGWAELLVGRPEAARERLDWIAARATPEGWLPEQTHEHLLAPDALAFWMAKWGPSACPLLWSHAMFLTLAHELGVTS